MRESRDTTGQHRWRTLTVSKSRTRKGRKPSQKNQGPPEQVTPEPKKTKRKTTPKSTGGVRKIRKNAKGEDCGFDLCAQTVEDIQGLTTLMTDRLAMAKEGYEYLLDVIHSALKAERGIEVHELVEYIEQHSQSGSNRKLEERIQELEQDLREEKALNMELQEATTFAKEAALDSNTRAKQVAASAAKVCSFVENIGEVLVAANLFKEGLQAAKDFASPTLRKFIRVVTDYQDKMECTLEEMRKSLFG
jgi:hypothetical protein